MIMDKFTENVNSQINEFIKENNNFCIEYDSLEGRTMIDHSWFITPRNYEVFDEYDANLIIDLSKRLGVLFWITTHNDNVAFELNHIEANEG